MAQFNLLALSTELILHIIDEVHPGDIESLAIGNRVIYTLCQSALQRHQDLKKQYSTLSLGGVKCQSYHHNNVWSFEGLHPLLALVEFLANPRLAYYPTKLRIGESDELEDFDDVINTLDDVFPTWKSHLALLANDPWLAQMDVELRQKWHNVFLDIGEFDDEPYYMGIFLAILPRIESLLVVHLEDDVSISDAMNPIGEIIDVIASANHDVESLMYGKALTTLHTVTVFRGSVANFAVFATLPSVHFLFGRDIDSRPDLVNTRCTHTLQGTGQLEELDIKNSDFSVDWFEWMLPNMTRLKRLEYHCDIDSATLPEGADAILRTIARHTAKSLERLELRIAYCDWWDPKIHQQWGSLRGFKVLRELKVELELFQDIGDDYYGEPTLDMNKVCTRLVNVLPASIRVLRFEGRHGEGVWRRIAAQIAREKANKFPGLQKVIFETSFDSVGDRSEGYY